MSGSQTPLCYKDYKKTKIMIWMICKQTILGVLLPQGFALPASGEFHCSRINDRGLREQGFVVLDECV